MATITDDHGRDVPDHITHTLRHPGSDQGGDDEWDDIIIRYPVINALQQGDRQSFQSGAERHGWQVGMEDPFPLSPLQAEIACSFGSSLCAILASSRHP
ncbi:hypothetical protein [Streptomyces mirabilis]|uniref:hypothetical protein n=1 Tax=Streptomyces mirabilis TaxID=68239 RepID=UPI003321E1C1